MVFFFETNEGYVIYMGTDKYENEDLIKYGLPEDIWFHVEDLSSAHVYLRLRKDQKLEDVSNETILECATLVKANSIEGCKLNTVDVIYTRWRNLHKTADMEVGSIGFHDRSKVKKLAVVKNNAIVNKLNRTKRESFPNLAELQAQRAAEFRADQKEEKRRKQIEDKNLQREREEQAKLKSYQSIMVTENMKCNADFEASVDDSASKKFEEDFM